MANRDRRDPSGVTRRTSGNTSPWRDPYGPSSTSWSMDPLSQIRRFSDQMDRWFDAFGMGRTGNRGEGANLWAPEMETFLRDDQFVIRLDVPGLSKDEVNVEVTDDSIVIHGERQQTHEENREGYYRSERSYGRFYREVALPDGAQADTAQANYRDGVLEVTLKVPPRQIQKPRRIEVGNQPGPARDRTMSAGSGGEGTPATGAGNVPIERPATSNDRANGRPDRSIAHDRPARTLDTE